MIKPINKTNIAQRNHCLIKIFGNGLLELNFEITISKKAPLGHKFQHQYLALKNDSVKKKAIMATTKYPSHGLNSPPITISGRNHTIINCVFFIYLGIVFLALAIFGDKFLDFLYIIQYKLGLT